MKKKAKCSGMGEKSMRGSECRHELDGLFACIVELVQINDRISPTSGDEVDSG